MKIFTFFPPFLIFFNFRTDFFDMKRLWRRQENSIDNNQQGFSQSFETNYLTRIPISQLFYANGREFSFPFFQSFGKTKKNTPSVCLLILFSFSLSFYVFRKVLVKICEISDIDTWKALKVWNGLFMAPITFVVKQHFLFYHLYILEFLYHIYVLDVKVQLNIKCSEFDFNYKLFPFSPS